MKKVHRLRKNKEFQQVFRLGKSVANRYFVLYFVTNKGDHVHRFGISVSKKLGGAVVRNRVKRLIREGLRQIEPRIPDHIDFVIIARKPVVDLSFDKVVSHLIHVFKRAQVFNSNREAKR
ncbi:ribonuclease P protein component [Microaerobacter geothermalis]|uniref:ribonuclease P protein component n=1 Tax=Microaerobacter geothermalis TaxID=674972 RepID=UPI001F325E77|nr:ribonuclease P protein component [Microaerobacter geothermalis]MCF6095096.1 ribonuclease P protein component [Microaerobacter geothermalis]